MFGLFKKRIKEPISISIQDERLVGLATYLLLGKTVTASNYGGGFENVKILSCEGIDDGKHGRYVKFKTDDSWITHVYYSEEQILNMIKNKIKS